MIPTAMLLGLLGGTSPGYRWWSIPVIGIVWSILLQTYGDPGMAFVDVWIVGFILGALNAALGVVVTWLLAWSIKALIGSPTENLGL